MGCPGWRPIAQSIAASVSCNSPRTVVELTCAFSNTTKIESQCGNIAGDERASKRMHHFVLHRTAVYRVWVADNRSSGDVRAVRRFQKRLDRARRSLDQNRFAVGHSVHEKLLAALGGRHRAVYIAFPVLPLHCPHGPTEPPAPLTRCTPAPHRSLAGTARR